MNKGKKIQTSFISFVKEKGQLTDWLILLVSCLIGYIVVKICYPYPATISDSGTYVQVAATDMFSFYRPFGYSYYLQIIHALSSSINALFVSQILLYFFASAAFAFVIKYIYPPVNKWLWRVMLFVFVFSPIAFYMSNAIMSDLLFAVLIYFMLAAFLYFFKNKGWISLCIYLLSLYFALQVRYSAIMFPLLFIVCLFFVKSNLRWLGIVGTIIVSFLFYNQVKQDMRRTTGFDQFSTGFDGWQVVNNALHVIPFIELPADELKDPEMKFLHQFILSQKDVIYKSTSQGKQAVASFMWINDLPLKQFLFGYIDYTKQSYPTSWVRLGSTTYKNYGNYLITHYPIEFMRYYYLPNSTSIIYPTNKEIIGRYTPINVKDIMDWYKIPEGTDLQSRYPIFENIVAEWSALSYIPLWLIVLTGIVLSVIFRKQLFWDNPDQSKIFWIVVAFGILYYSATVFASPISLRFWIPMNAVLFAIIYILYNRLFEYKLKKQNG